MKQNPLQSRDLSLRGDRPGTPKSLRSFVLSHACKASMRQSRARFWEHQAGHHVDSNRGFAKGFTLLETLIAMIILSTGIILLVNSWGGAFTRIRKTEMHVEVSALLEKKMAEIESEYRGKSVESIPEEKEDDFGSDYAKYSWKLESKALPMPDLSATLSAAGEGGVKPEMLMIVKQFTEHISKSVKEVKVTVIYKGGKKPLTFSAVTYFVDFDKAPPALGGGGL